MIASECTPANTELRTPPPATLSDADLLDTVTGWLRLLADTDSGGVVELRAVDCQTRFFRRPHIQAGFFDIDHLELMAEKALELNKISGGVYFTINPVHRDLLARRANRVDVADSGQQTSDVNVTKRRWFLIDVDPVRISGISSTNAEKSDARETIEAIRAYLAALGWPDPIVADSGNGFHLLYRIDLPTDDGGLVKRCIKALAARFDTDAEKVDTSVFNPSRVSKVYGTVSGKGDHTPERPHRRSAIIEIPDAINPVPVELLEALAAIETQESAEQQGSQQRESQQPDASIIDRARKYVDQMPAAISGQKGHNATFKVACRLVLGFGLSPESAFPVMEKYNHRCQPPWTEKELRHKLEDADKKPGERGYLLNGREPESAWTTSADEQRPPRCHTIKDAKPEVFLPGGSVSISETATTLGTLLAATGRFFVRGGPVVEVTKDDSSQPILRVIKPAELASTIESVATIVKWAASKDGPVQVNAICNEANAKLILHARAFQDQLPRIRLLSPCPVLVEQGAELVQVSGYDRESGVLAFGEKVDDDIPVGEAVNYLKELPGDFRFASPTDRSRGIAALITPALVQGNLLDGHRAPIDLGEADQSQTGKGFRNRITAALYRQQVHTVTQKRQGVGSLEESFNQKLIQGANFISLDNVRGKIDSPAIESFMTEETYSARVPFLAEVEIETKRIVVMMTSNKAEITDDLARRSSCTRLLKQADGYEFVEYPEGDVLDHVREHQPLYLACVFSIVREWHRQRRRRTKENRHDFKRWARILDWIVQEIFQAAPLLDGHRETQKRMVNPVLNWVRDVGIVVCSNGHAGKWLRAHQLLDMLANTDVEIPGVSETDDLDSDHVRNKVLPSIGRKMGKAFGAEMSLHIDDMLIEKRKGWDDLSRERYEYQFTKVHES